MQTFNDVKKKITNNVAQPVKSEFVQEQLANKANPTVTGGASVPTVSNVAPRTSAIPGVKVYNNAPAMIGNFDFDTDFQAQINDALARGDYGAAAMFEKLRNQKLGYMNSPYSTTYRFNYNDPYRGQLERMQDDSINREEFSYDYRDDDQYKAIKRLKEKEAQKAYDDGYGAMSRQFEGDVPVAMINKLLDTKADIVDQADSYIPQLRQLAYQMYMNEGDQMMRNYSMMQDAAARDYDRWAADRNITIAGNDNAYSRAYGERAYDRGVFTEDRAWDYNVSEQARNHEREDAQYKNDISATNSSTILEIARDIISMDKSKNYADAINEAMEIARAGGLLLAQ